MKNMKQGLGPKNETDDFEEQMPCTSPGLPPGKKSLVIETTVTKAVPSPSSIYVRGSNDDGDSVQRQLEICKAMARRLGEPEPEVFVDISHPGQPAALPALMSLLDKLSLTQGCAVFVESADRLLRYDSKGHPISYVLENNQILVFDRSGPVDSSSIIDAAEHGASDYKLLVERLSRTVRSS